MARSAPVFVGSEFVAQYPEGGGVFWVPLQYLLGLRDLGIDAWWLELLYTSGDAVRDRARIDALLSHADSMGVRERIVLVYFPDGGREQPPGRREVIGLPERELEARMRDGLLLNLVNSVPPPLRASFARTALLDLDPGLFQIWAREHDLGVGSHDAHLTIGMNLGAPDCPAPSDDVAWRKFWPPVHLPSWATQTDAPSQAPYTSVTQWWTEQYAFLDGVTYDGNKRTGWLACVELPSRTKARLELAANLHAGEVEDRALLARHGWRVVDPARVAGDPKRFRAYVQASRGELCCAKPAFARTRSGWLSDRTVCYLASGRPCVTQATGAERHLPPCPGLRFFHGVDEAAEALDAIESDRHTASRAARALAEEVFSTRAVLPGVLAAAEG